MTENILPIAENIVNAINQGKNRRIDQVQQHGLYTRSTYLGGRYLVSISTWISCVVSGATIRVISASLPVKSFWDQEPVFSPAKDCQDRLG